MLAVRQVESGTTVMTAVAVVTETLGTTLNDITHAILIFSVQGGNVSRSDREAVRGEILSTTQIRFTRGDSTGNIPAIQWQVIEFDAGVVDVQRGNEELDATPSDVTITTVGDLDNAWEILSGIESVETNWAAASFWQMYLTSVTNLRFDAHATSAGSFASWQVVKFEDGAEFSTERGTVPTDTAATTEFTDSISSVDLAKSFVTQSNRANGSLASGSGSYRASFNSATEIQIEKGLSNTADADSRWLVGEFANVDVQGGTLVIDSGQTEDTVAISSVSADRLLMGSGHAGLGNGAGEGTWSITSPYTPTNYGMTFNSSIEVKGVRGATLANSEVSFFVMDFSPVAPVIRTQMRFGA